ncbi:Unknown protein, partial [Striga hermonthica]
PVPPVPTFAAAMQPPNVLKALEGVFAKALASQAPGGNTVAATKNPGNTLLQTPDKEAGEQKKKKPANSKTTAQSPNRYALERREKSARPVPTEQTGESQPDRSLQVIRRSSIANIVQGEDESLKDYITRFNDRVQNMEQCHLETLLVSVQAGLRLKTLFNWSLCQNKPTTYQEFFTKAQNYIIAEESSSIPVLDVASSKDENKEKSGKPGKSFAEVRAMRRQRAEELKESFQGIFSVGVAAVYEEIKTKGLLPDTKLMFTDKDKVDKSRYYTYHKAHGHNTDQCRNLIDAFLFDHPHSDALVITAPIMAIKIDRIMVNTGAYASILYYSTFKKMGIERKEVHPCREWIQEFNGQMTTPVGQVTLPIRFREKGQPTRMILETFKIVDCPSEYNVILGRTALYKLRGA